MGFALPPKKPSFCPGLTRMVLKTVNHIPEMGAGVGGRLPKILYKDRGAAIGGTNMEYVMAKPEYKQEV
jgi:hypothetical protein